MGLKSKVQGTLEREPHGLFKFRVDGPLRAVQDGFIIKPNLKAKRLKVII